MKSLFFSGRRKKVTGVVVVVVVVCGKESERAAGKKSDQFPSAIFIPLLYGKAAKKSRHIDMYDLCLYWPRGRGRGGEGAAVIN